MAYVALSDITKNNINIKIKVRVARSWDFTSTINNQVFSSDLLLIDEHGDTIHATMSNEVGQKFKSIISEGTAYHISGFIITTPSSKYRMTSHPFRLRFLHNTYIKKIEDDTDDIPYDKFNFLSFQEVNARINPLDYLIDTFGLLIKLGKVENVRIGSQIREKRKFTLQDARGEEINITLWGQLATTFPEDMIFDIAQNKPVAIAVVAMIPKEFEGVINLNNSAGSKLYVNPNIPEICSFVETLPKPYPTLEKDKTPSAPLADIETEKENNRKNIEELMDVDIHTDKEIKFTCKDKIKEIDPSEGWWYRSCPKCHNGVQNVDNKLFCKVCMFIDDIPVPWYRLKLVVEDNTGFTSFIVFGHLAANLLGIPAITLANSFKDKHDVPPIMKQIYGQERLFQVQVSNSTQDPSSLTFKVKHIFNTDTLTPKKEIISPFSTPSTHLKSPMSIYCTPTCENKQQSNEQQTVDHKHLDEPPPKKIRYQSHSLPSKKK